MNKKIISILLIMSLLTVGLTSVAANQTTDSSSNNEPLSTGPLSGDDSGETPSVTDGSDTDVSKQYDQPVDVAKEEESNTTESNKTDSTNQINNTKTDDKNIQLLTLITKLDKDSAKEFLTILSLSDNPNMKELFNAFLNYNGDTTKVLEVIDSLSDDEYDALMTLLYILSLDNSGSSTAPSSNGYQVQKVSNSEKITSNEGTTSNNDNNNNIIKTGFTPKKSSKINSDNTKQNNFDNLFEKIISAYFDGKITFNEMVSSLALLGYDTSTIELNPDGSFVWDGFLFTKNGMKEYNNQSKIDDKNSTDTNTNKTDATDNTDVTDNVDVTNNADLEDNNDNTANNGGSTPAKGESQVPSNNNAESNDNSKFLPI